MTAVWMPEHNGTYWLADQKSKGVKRQYVLHAVIYNEFLGERAQVWWPVPTGCCVGQTTSRCCIVLGLAFFLQVADDSSLSSCNNGSRLQLHSDNTSILSLTLL